MRGIGFCAAATVFAALVLGAASARAAVSLPVGSGYVQCSTTSGLIIGTSCNGGTDSGLVTFAPDAGVSGSAFGQGLVDEANVFGVLNYSFEVIGGTPGTVVPVDIETTLQAIPEFDRLRLLRDRCRRQYHGELHDLQLGGYRMWRRDW